MIKNETKIESETGAPIAYIVFVNGKVDLVTLDPILAENHKINRRKGWNLTDIVAKEISGTLI